MYIRYEILIAEQLYILGGMAASGLATKKVERYSIDNGGVLIDATMSRSDAYFSAIVIGLTKLYQLLYFC